jgi:hypothetical protein
MRKLRRRSETAMTRVEARDEERTEMIERIAGSAGVTRIAIRLKPDTTDGICPCGDFV